MDLNQHFGKIIEGLVADITSNVLVQVDGVISNAINNRLATYDFSTHIKEAASAAFEKRVNNYQIDSKKLESRIAERINITISQVESNTAAIISDAVTKQVAATNFQQAMTDAVGTIISDRLHEYVFPENSIRASSINFSNYTISGDLIRGGIVTEFSSTGIDDRSTNVALTILDDVTVVENNLLTKDLTVEGAMTINGKFVVNGEIPKDSEFYQTLITDSSSTTLDKLDNTFFNTYSDIIFNKIKTDGLDLNRITIDGKEIIKDSRLGPSIMESNLQTLGLVRELQVSGETFLAQTLYISGKRVGINTIEPSTAFSVWDDEVEVIVAKKQQDTGIIGTPRQQRLVISANGKDNVVVEPDGSTRIDDLRIGSIRFTSSPTPPNYVSERGHIAWNTNPNPGGPMGWICLGAANWANFGIID